VRGRDASKPVLLFLAGGPGGSQLATARYALGGPEEHFVVVNWEQPGSGKSFDAVDRATITPERYIEDAHALVLQLRERFGQDKVYVLGESWGNALGIMLVRRYPELFHAFIGTGQAGVFDEARRVLVESGQFAFTTRLPATLEIGSPLATERSLVAGIRSLTTPSISRFPLAYRRHPRRSQQK
jgi:pimeloyl-ACP methyl ester carboxylesterase